MNDMWNPFNGLKCLLYKQEINGILNKKLLPPVTVEIDPSNVCNHNCIWCMFKKYRTDENSIIQKNDLYHLINTLSDFGVKHITFTGGGEPLANPYIIPIIKYAYTKGLQIGLVTNGGLLNTNMIKTIATCCRFLRVSIDAGTMETHHQLHRTRNKKEFLKIINHMRIFAKYPKLDVGYSYLVTNKNYDEIETAIHLARNMGCSYIQIRPVIGEKLDYYTMSHINKKIQSYKTIYSEHNFHIEGMLHRFDEVLFKKCGFDKCYASPLLAVIGANLKMYLCCQFRGNPEWELGDLSKNDFCDIWGNKHHWEMLNKIDIANCPPCRYKFYNQAIEHQFLRDDMHGGFL